jgi:trafficking protein particle complex subunit 10
VYVCLGSSGLDANSKLPPNRSASNLMTRTMSGPATSETSLPVDRPMRLSEIHVAAEHALKQTISDPDFMTSLSSLEEFEVLYSCTSQIFFETMARVLPFNQGEMNFLYKKG